MSNTKASFYLRPNLLVFGSKNGGSFESLVQAWRAGKLNARSITLVVDDPDCEAVRRARRLRIHYIPFDRLWTVEGYQWMFNETSAHLAILLGWPRIVPKGGLDPRKAINNHPGPLPLTAGLYGLKVHEKVIEAFNRSEITYTEINVHQPTSEVDCGPIVFKKQIRIRPGETVKSLTRWVKRLEQIYQPGIINQRVTEIYGGH